MSAFKREKKAGIQDEDFQQVYNWRDDHLMRDMRHQSALVVALSTIAPPEKLVGDAKHTRESK